MFKDFRNWFQCTLLAPPAVRFPEICNKLCPSWANSKQALNQNPSGATKCEVESRSVSAEHANPKG